MTAQRKKSLDVWHAVMTAAGRTAPFEAQHHLRLRGYRTWLLFEKAKVRYRVPGGFKYRLLRTAYYPGYLFCRVELHQDVAGVNRAPAVSTIIYRGEEPVQVPPDVMEREFSLGDPDTGYVGERDDVRAPTRYSPGSLVRFTDASFLPSMEGIVQYCRHGDIRVWCDAIRREITTTVEKVEPL